ncbi:hypothetical protein GXW82_15560 [Streptacidiphilus sp. 4-A2]|nr:hypothetical protein [Streptacidiphilus sp. 4-A2]
MTSSTTLPGSAPLTTGSPPSRGAGGWIRQPACVHQVFTCAGLAQQVADASDREDSGAQRVTAACQSRSALTWRSHASEVPQYLDPGHCRSSARRGHTLPAHLRCPLREARGQQCPGPAHVVVVMEENHSYSDIIGNTTDAPYINSLAGQGALMTSSYGVTHPSEPNYMALFSGSTDGLTADTCPVSAGNTANLGSELLAAGDTFKGYSEGLSSTGSTSCTSGEYARKHSPWINFSNVPASDSLPFSSFPTNYSTLPTLSFVIPNLDDDMHDGTIQQADSWLDTNMSAYATWAKANNSLLIVTWDEDDYTENNQVPTIVVGQQVKPGSYDETINHYNLLATLEAMYGLGQVGSSSGLSPITDIWTGSGGSGPANTVTVTNPGTQTATAGSAASLQVNAADSASGQTLTYSATGLPAGMSISSSGLISGTPTTSGTDSVIVTATDSTGASGSAAFSYTVNPASGADTVTLANPGSQTATVGTAASLQLSGADSASGQALAYSATGLPPGLSIGSASGLISGTPTTAGTYNVALTADDTTGASASTSFTWTVNAATASGCTASQLLGNPGFETGAITPWTSTDGVLSQSSSQSPAHSGSWLAWLDGYSAAHTDTLAQTVTIPATCKNATFSFWYEVQSSTAAAGNTLAVNVLNSSGTVLGTLTTVTGAQNSSSYAQYSVTGNLDAYIGQTVTLQFTGTEAAAGDTSFFVDDNALNVS